jgi:TonB family protein
MSILFDDARLSTRPHDRWTTGLWLSVVLHAVVVVVLIVVPIGASETSPAPSMRSKMVFVMPATALVKLPPVPLVAPRLPPAAPPRPVREPARAEMPKPLPVAPIVAKVVEPAPAPLVPAAVERPIEKPVIQRPPETGLFDRTNAARTSQAAAAVTTGGFGSAAASPRDAAIGAVKTGGFGSTAASPRDAATGAVKTGGFGSEAPAARRVANGEVQTAGFDQRASAPAQPSVAAATKPIDRPVEIISKPTPEYTDEARSARIEGTVSLELEFTAAGEVRVLRVVRGLSHGLDEAAQRAALRIRFKPAQSSDGRPVDSRATVHITFRLS